MSRIFIGFMICFLLLNCSKKKENFTTKNKPYIISYENKKFRKYSDSLEKNSNKVTFPSIKGFYCQNQLLIDKKGNLFFYQKEYIHRICGYKTGADTIPSLLKLQPVDLVKIPQSCINDFLSLNIFSKEKNEQRLIIASQNDTIKNTSILNFINKLQTYKIRRTTQEEDTVLRYKKNNKFYNYEDIKWGKDKIIFPFIKPKLEKIKN